ncbi:GerAB/ArcD/ProY family transporter [Brevibacillus sp. H7]|uniref:GerAB/ArcD/ProY family transporter n=1 Tax=Brevibacillus sp. H7 TaxID=3349138 RepID=UPI003829FCD9
MTAFSLYDKTSTFGGIYLLFLANRLQMLYFFIIMPTYLVHPYMIWGIIGIGLLSQINLILLSKWFSSDFATKGYQGFVELFGKRAVRFFALVGLFIMLINITVITVGKLDIVQEFIFPSMDKNWLILCILLICCYIAAKGMEKTIRFVVIAFFSTIWLVLLFYPFFLPPIAALHDLYPLIPTDWSLQSWKELLFVWSALSGPEYLIFLGPWLDTKQRMLKYLTIANTITILEYVLVFVTSLLFFGSHYLSKINFPVVHMVRFLQSPVFERIDIILISVHMFHLILVVALFLLFIYGAIRITAGRVQKETTRIGFMTSCGLIMAWILIVNQWFWQTEAEQNRLLNLTMWLGAFTYLVVPASLLVAVKRKGRI